MFYNSVVLRAVCSSSIVEDDGIAGVEEILSVMLDDDEVAAKGKEGWKEW